MLRTIALALGLFTITAATAEAGKRRKADDELVRVPSASDFETTLTKLEKALEERKLTVFGTIDHHEAAMRVDMELAPSTVVIFGSPKVGTKLMQPAPSMGLDLPMKMLVTEPTPGAVEVVYRPIGPIAEQHGVKGRDEVIAKVTDVLASIAADAVR